MLAPSSGVTPAPAERPVTGRRVLTWLLAFFGVIIAVNGVMAWLAVSSFRGTVVDSSYRAGQRFNSEAEAARSQQARGWAVAVDVTRTADGGADLQLSARDGSGAPVTGHAATVQLQRPIDRQGDVVLALTERGAGIFSAHADRLEPGQWDVVVVIADRQRQVFRSRNRIVLP